MNNTAPLILADLLKGGRQLRPAQVEMAIQVARAIQEQVPIILEAPTGTGKTMAYLVPLLRSGQTVIISTANKALQDQIFFKDVPFLQKHVRPFEAVMVKGIGNYVCRDRLRETSRDLRVFDQYPVLGQLLDLIEEDASFAGDFESLPFTLDASVRNRINGDRDECAWQKCDFFNQCYIRAMREEAKYAQIIIVNHTLLLLNAATDGAILPPHDIVVIDEAHHLADEARSAFTASVRPTQITSLLGLRVVKELAPENLYKEIGQATTNVWNRVEQTPFVKATKIPFRQPVQEALTLATKLKDLVAALREKRPADQTEKEIALYDKLLKRIQHLAADIELVFNASGESNYVHYVEQVMTTNSTRLQVCAAPLDVAPFLKKQLFEKSPCVVMTSATLSTVGQRATEQMLFEYFRKQVGLLDQEGVIERVLPPTFDYQKNSLLYIPRGIPEPAYGGGAAVEQRYMQAIADEMYKLVMASHGRAFLLFSSRRMLEEVYRRIASKLPFPLLRQGSEMSRAEMTRRFRAEEGSVLFGLKSFWEGVDIAGDALSLVVIDKLPFGTPDDPVDEAWVNQMKANGENWFGTYVLPRVILQLKQGVGRLLRTQQDRGVIAILDTRLQTRGYGKEVIAALPKSSRTAQISDIEMFFKQEAKC